MKYVPSTFSKKTGSLRQDDVVFDPGSLPVCIHVLVTSDFSGSQG
jgi:hypothetical protein